MNLSADQLECALELISILINSNFPAYSPPPQSSVMIEVFVLIATDITLIY
jgi:hypothetical protein